MLQNLCSANDLGPESMRKRDRSRLIDSVLKQAKSLETKEFKKCTSPPSLTCLFYENIWIHLKFETPVRSAA